MTVVVPPWAAAIVPVSKSSVEVMSPSRHVEVRVRVDAARHHVAPRRVEHRIGLRRQALPNARDDAVLDEHVGGHAAGVRENGAVADERRGHGSPRSRVCPYHPIRSRSAVMCAVWWRPCQA